MRTIRLPNNQNKAVTNSRDTQEVLAPQCHEVLRVFKEYRPSTCILQDFEFYDREEEKRLAAKKQLEAKAAPKRIMKRPKPQKQSGQEPAPSTAPASTSTPSTADTPAPAQTQSSQGATDSTGGNSPAAQPAITDST